VKFAKNSGHEVVNSGAKNKHSELDDSPEIFRRCDIGASNENRWRDFWAIPERRISTRN